MSKIGAINVGSKPVVNKSMGDFKAVAGKDYDPNSSKYDTPALKLFKASLAKKGK
jgi:hypothetical protein